jgi:hypothetical protein
MDEESQTSDKGDIKLPWQRYEVSGEPAPNSIEWHHAELNRILDVIDKDGYEALDDEDIAFVMIHTHTGYVSLSEFRYFLPATCRKLTTGESPFDSDMAVWLLFLKLQEEGILSSSEKSMIEDAFLRYASAPCYSIPFEVMAIINFAVVWHWDADRVFKIWKGTLMFQRAVRDFKVSGLTADEYFINMGDGPKKFLPSSNPENYKVLMKYVTLCSS